MEQDLKEKAMEYDLKDEVLKEQDLKCQGTGPQGAGL